MSKNKIPSSIWKNPVHFVAFGFGSGALPTAPGTYGSLVGVLLYLVIDTLPVSVYLTLTILAFLIGVRICGVTSRDLGVHDHPGIVWDEIVGYLITMIAVPRGWFWVTLGFILFRFFDIFKPFPIRQLDAKVKGGFGIMLDDAIAGLYAWLVMMILVFLF